eukprot:g2860.t1
MKRELLTELSFLPRGSVIIYISHQWVGINHPDPRGDQFYHLVLLLERLLRGDVSRTDMDAFHSLLYKHNYTTTAEEWRLMLDPEKTFIFYDGFCVSKEERDEAFRFVPEIIKRCDFMIILAPGCTHFDKIDPRTGRKMNLCYRTYRLNAMCVFEMFSAFLTTKGGERVRPALLVRSGGGVPKWSSPLECQKLAVGMSTFECCERNHTVFTTCLRVSAKHSLVSLINMNVLSLFEADMFPAARFSVMIAHYWLRGLADPSEFASTSKRELKLRLRWDNTDGEGWFDRNNFSILFFAVMNHATNVVSALLKHLAKKYKKGTHDYTRHVRSAIPSEGLPRFGFTGGTTALHIAMAGTSFDIITLLLEYGADSFETDVAGNDPLMFASIFGHTDNVKLWLKRFPDWDLERKNKVVGGVALGQTVYMGPHRLELVKVLLEHGASTGFKNFSGASILTSLCSSEDCDPKVVELVLKHESQSVNYRRRGQSLKWRNIYRLARVLVRTKVKKAGIMVSLARACGSTALHYAVRRGDVDVVNLLLCHGADPEITDGLNKSPVDYCDAFPEMRGALKRVIQQQKEGKLVMLHRRNSTATNLKFPMYLVPLDQLQRLYGGTEPRYDRIEAHQELLRRGELVRWIDLPIDAHIIFMSHEWVGWNHPDPHGVQLKTFLRVMQRLRSGEISQIEMNVFHTLMYKTNYVVKAEKWQDILSRAYVSISLNSLTRTLTLLLTSRYVWIDWSSMPQPSACPPSTDKKVKEKLGTNLGKAVKSIPAYVEKSDFVVVVAPGCLHADRRDKDTNLRAKTCYRTYRKRGWCVLEIFSSFLSREKTHPILLITSSEDPFETDKGGHDALMAASVYGRAYNIDRWLEVHSKWEMERKCKQGTTALSSAVYLGQNKLGTIHRLLEADAKLTTLNNSGASYLTLACSNEDSDPKVVRFLLENMGDSYVNLRM